MRKLAASSTLLLSLFLSLGLAQAGPLRITLLADTTVQGDTILLAHLLPSSVPSELLERARNISLGPSPEPGGVREISRAAIQATLAKSAWAAGEFVIPERVVVRSDANPGFRDRVWLAICAAAAARRLALPANFRSEDLGLAAPEMLFSPNAPLEVREVSIDRLLDQIRFRLRISNNPSSPSFYAWCPVPQESGVPGAPLSQTRSHMPSSLSAPPALQPVSTRRLATLHLHSENSSALLQVRPLECGQLGQAIRVRIPANGRTLVARVAGTDLLDAVF